MKYLFASDVHGSVADMRRLLEIIEEEKPDKSVFLGDFFGYGSYIEMSELFRRLGGKFTYVEGNCDGGLHLYGVRASARSVTLNIGGRSVFCCHGHLFSPSDSRDMLDDGDIFIYGHLHTPFIEEQNGITVVNDGSMARPRGGFPKTYAIIDDDGVCIKDEDGAEIMRKLFLYD